MRKTPLTPEEIANEMVEFEQATRAPHPTTGSIKPEWSDVARLIATAILRERWRYRLTKWIPDPRNNPVDYVHDAKRNAKELYWQAKSEDGSASPLQDYDFERGFEYGMAFVLDHPELYEKLQQARKEIYDYKLHTKRSF